MLFPSLRNYLVSLKATLLIMAHDALSSPTGHISQRDSCFGIIIPFYLLDTIFSNFPYFAQVFCRSLKKPVPNHLHVKFLLIDDQFKCHLFHEVSFNQLQRFTFSLPYHWSRKCLALARLLSWLEHHRNAPWLQVQSQKKLFKTYVILPML